MEPNDLGMTHVDYDDPLTPTFQDGFSIVSPSGWWFGTLFIFPYIGNAHPN
jgi:hypothetical protein